MVGSEIDGNLVIGSVVLVFGACVWSLFKLEFSGYLT